jgi:hypothetical protein
MIGEGDYGAIGGMNTSFRHFDWISLTDASL